MAADAVDDAINNRRQNMQAYVADWFMNRCVPLLRRAHSVMCYHLVEVFLHIT
jgi:hypothetical protein